MLSLLAIGSARHQRDYSNWCAAASSCGSGRASTNMSPTTCSPPSSKTASRRGAAPEASRSAIGNATRLPTGPGLLAFFDAPWVPLPGAHFPVPPGARLCRLRGRRDPVRADDPVGIHHPRSLAAGLVESMQAHRFAETSLRNADVIWALGMLGDLRRRWQDKHLAALAYSGKATDQLGTYSAIAKFVRPLLQIAMLGFGAYLVIEEAISAGVMIASFIVMGRALQPVEASIVHWRSFISARSAYSRLTKLLGEYDVNRQRMAVAGAAWPDRCRGHDARAARRRQAGADQHQLSARSGRTARHYRAERGR